MATYQGPFLLIHSEMAKLTSSIPSNVAANHLFGNFCMGNDSLLKNLVCDRKNFGYQTPSVIQHRLRKFSGYYNCHNAKIRVVY